MGWAVLGGLIPTSLGHQGHTQGSSALPSRGCRATLGAWASPVLPLPPVLGQLGSSC